MPERLSIDLTNRCYKQCNFCYNGSGVKSVSDHWLPEEIERFVADCARHGTRSVSFGGGEPFEYPGLFGLLDATRNICFRSITTNGIALADNSVAGSLLKSKPDKVQFSIHFPDCDLEVERVISQVRWALSSKIKSGINLLIDSTKIEETYSAAKKLRERGIGNELITYIPMKYKNAPTPEQVSYVAGNKPFQSSACLTGCRINRNFCSVTFDKKVNWCSFDKRKIPLEDLTYSGLSSALDKINRINCQYDKRN